MSLLALFGAEDAEWVSRALCAQVDPEAFFPEKGGSTKEAKRVCLVCDVRPECLDYALVNGERFGIWGGLSERERRKVLRSTTTTPVLAPVPTTPEVETVMPEEVPQSPTYVEQIVALMAATEGHPDPAVRGARKTVANALVALSKTLRESSAPPPPVVPGEPKTWARANNSARLSERVAQLGVTSKVIRAWAVDQGLPNVPDRGALPERLVDAYEAAHEVAAS